MSRAENERTALDAARDAIVRHDAGIPQRPDFDVWEALRVALDLADRRIEPRALEVLP